MPRNQSGRRRTPQQRKRDAAARRSAEPTPVDAAPAGADENGGGGEAGGARPTAGGGGSLSFNPFRRQRPVSMLTPEQMEALAATRWSLRGRLTLALMIAIFIIPFGILGYFQRGSLDYDYSFAALLIFPLAPSQLIPVPLVLATFVGMPLARALAREPRPYRILETLGFVATVDICLIVVWGPLPHSAASFTDPKVVAAAALADVVGLIAGALAYGPLTHYLSPKRRMQQR